MGSDSVDFDSGYSYFTFDFIVSNDSGFDIVFAFEFRAEYGFALKSDFFYFWVRYLFWTGCRWGCEYIF